jgi:hypothetical protein
VGEKIAQWQTMWTRFAASPWYRVVQIAIVGVAISLMTRVLALSLSQIDWANLQFDPSALFIALLLTWIAFYLGTFAWGEIVCALHPELSYLQAIEQHLQSVAAKYLPGVGWQQVSKAAQLYYRGNVPASQTLLTVVLEMVLVVFTGLAVALQSLTPRTVLGLSPDLQSGIALLLWMVCAALPFAVLKLVNKRIDNRRLALHLYLAELFDVIGWFTFGLALWFIIRAIDPLPWDVLPYCIATLALSIVTGLVVVIVPNGYGIRELTMSALLQVFLPVPSSIIVALVSRVVLVAAEFIGVLPIMWLIGRRAARE